MPSQPGDAPRPPWPECVELGEWTPIPVPVPASIHQKLKEIDPEVSRPVKRSQILTFHTVGCTGCHADQSGTARVASAMARQLAHPKCFGGLADAEPAAFLYHLGDVVYRRDKTLVGEQSPLPPPDGRRDFATLYDLQFYRQYADYPQPIFAIAGNHDGKAKDADSATRKSGIHHFLKNFCGLADEDPPDNQSTPRQPTHQPYPYWVLETPIAYFVGLYTNVNNGGQLDNPQSDAQPQYDWLVRTLTQIRQSADGKAVFLMTHYPPYSSAANFVQRGDPNLGPTPRPAGKVLLPIGMHLQEAFKESGMSPDAVFSAHAHLYQRLTYTTAAGKQIPYLIAGTGGHMPIEKLNQPCSASETPMTAREPRLQPVFPTGLKLPSGDQVELTAYSDKDFGFLRITQDQGQRTLVGEYFAVPAGPDAAPRLYDSFRLNLRSHKLND